MAAANGAKIREVVIANVRTFGFVFLFCIMFDRTGTKKLSVNLTF